jgi:hypothetical protein
MFFLAVIPAQAGIQWRYSLVVRTVLRASHKYFDWIPAFAGMTVRL